MITNKDHWWPWEFLFWMVIVSNDTYITTLVVISYISYEKDFLLFFFFSKTLGILFCIWNQLKRIFLNWDQMVLSSWPLIQMIEGLKIFRKETFFFLKKIVKETLNRCSPIHCDNIINWNILIFIQQPS